MPNYIYIAAAILLISLFVVIFLSTKKKKQHPPSQISTLDKKLEKTKKSLVGRISELLKFSKHIDEQLLEDLEEILLQADVGVQTATDIISKLKNKIHEDKLSNPENVYTELEKIVKDLLLTDYSDTDLQLEPEEHKPYIILFAGVNGVGKTTTIGKLAKKYTQMGKKVMLIAADTFRAAAIEQLTVWAQRANAAIMKQQQGADPSAVVYDGVSSSVHKKLDVVLIDTAGRQHTKLNLMNELNKITRTIKKIVPSGPHESLLVVDATTGQNALQQAEIFHNSINLTGLVLTKLDGTAKGGIVLGIKHQMNIPVKLIGVGEGVDDLKIFDINAFVKAIFE
ncbi:MAG: signal recognition particle-docking protein FtsY [Candidatus Cloacimonadota bacterium]|nr:signal recognition particle-docking protein FtsY [Candidatus Cloacimonadota bacterium]